ncbi:MAG: CBS domain-containing protein [Planctomycetales bacterium]|nr:CBS domain-containing protein [Planctomycetales bacterium]
MAERTDSVLARDIMVPTKKLVTLRAEMDALKAVRMLLKHQISGAPVVDDDNGYLGVFSEKTSMQFLLRLSYESLPSGSVGAFMNTDLDRTISEEEDLISILDLFLRTPYRRLPVLCGDKLVGQISRRDALCAATKSLDCPQSVGKQLLYLSALVKNNDAALRF